MLLLVSLAVVLILLAVWCYSSESFTRGPPNDKVQIIYHFAPWCPHCQLMTPVYSAVKARAPAGYIFEERDQQPTPDVQGYPTIIKIDRMGKRFTYVGPADGMLLSRWMYSPAGTQIG